MNGEGQCCTAARHDGGYCTDTGRDQFRFSRGRIELGLQQTLGPLFKRYASGMKAEGWSGTK